MEVVMADIEAQTVFKKEIHPVSLKFEDVVYTLTIKHEGYLKKSKSEDKLILNGVSGIVFPGEMLAMLGPSGSGKTTLLTALGGRLGGLLGGTITYNGKPFSSAMKQNTGFVTQDDLLYPHLTVTETLVYTALLRLPNSMSKQEKVNHAEAVILQLGLSRCRDSIIGGPFLRGISGGERKRVSIGQEMLINPSLLFLDEPTSGLDSTTAQRIVHTLWELANGGHTVVMTIHQPSSRLFYMFHKVLLLSEGKPLYFGKGASAMDYFASIGFSPSVAMNPSDFLLDLANGVSTDDSREDQAAVKQTLISAYKANLAERVKSEHASDRHLQEATDDKQFKRWSTSWWQQFSVLFKRGVKARMHESFSKIRTIEILIMSVLAGLLWWQSGRSHIQDQVALFFFYCGFWGFYQVESAIFVFPQERMILEKERQAGMYSLSSFFMAVTLGNLPMRLVLPTAFVTITYWMAGLKATAANFLGCLFILLFSILCFEGLGLAIGALVMNQKSATTLGSVFSFLMLLTGGFYLQHIPKFIAWLKYVSITNYTFKLLLHSQYNPDETYPCGTNGTCLVEDFPTVKAVGLRGGVVVSLAALVVMLVAYRLIAYIALMRIGVLRR